MQKQYPTEDSYSLSSAIDYEEDEKRWSRFDLARKIFRSIVLVVCFSGCCWQCVLILDMYLSYPTTVFVFLERMDILEAPGLTLCNSNR